MLETPSPFETRSDERSSGQGWGVDPQRLGAAPLTLNLILRSSR
jgi:hypothetical protein